MSKALKNDRQMDKGPGRTDQVKMDDRNSRTAQPEEGHVNWGRKTWASPGWLLHVWASDQLQGHHLVLVRNATSWPHFRPAESKSAFKQQPWGDLYIQHIFRGPVLEHPEIHPS